MSESIALTYDQLLNNRPAFCRVDRHASFDDSGVILVWADPAVQGVALTPGQQLNVDHDAGAVTAYSVGPADGEPEVEVEPEPEEPGEEPAPEPEEEPEQIPAEDEAPAEEPAEEEFPCSQCDRVLKTEAGRVSHEKTHED